MATHSTLCFCFFSCACFCPGFCPGLLRPFCLVIFCFFIDAFYFLLFYSLSVPTVFLFSYTFFFFLSTPSSCLPLPLPLPFLPSFSSSPPSLSTKSRLPISTSSSSLASGSSFFVSALFSVICLILSTDFLALAFCSSLIFLVALSPISNRLTPGLSSSST